MADKGGLLGTFFMAFTLALVSFSCTGPIIGTALVQVASSGSYVGPFMVMLGFSTALALPFGLFAAFPSWLNSLPRSGGWMTTVKVVLGFLELALALKFGYLATGFKVNKETKSYDTPALTSGLAPPATYNFFLEPEGLDKSIKAKYPSYTKCANNINCFKDYYDGLAYAKEVKKPVFLDFTGYGCVNCRKTEEHIWVDPAVRSKLNDDYVLVSLYVDDRKKIKETLYAGELSGYNKLRNIGNKWADFQITNFEQNSQPLYVIMNTNQEVVAHPRGYREGIDVYNDFLDCGLKAVGK